jgi:5-methylcytosine-specific restriction endonuclease McrA
MSLEHRDGVEGKVCRVCGNWKSVTEFRQRTQAFGDGYYNQCRECERIADRNRRLTNPAAEKAKTTKYRNNNRDTLLEKQRAKRAVESETHRERARKWKNENPEAVDQARQKWRRNNKHLEREQARNWRKNNPEKVREQVRQRRVRKMATGGKHTPEEWEELKAYYNYSCVRCGRREPDITLERDHIVPLGHPGSSDDISNIQPLCRTCNAAKGTRNADYRLNGCSSLLIVVILLLLLTLLALPIV